MSQYSKAGRGALIVFEGVDRCGKTTQTKRLVQALHKHEIRAELLRFPDRTLETGKLIDAYLKNPESDLDDRVVHMLFAINRWELAKSIEKKLQDGTTLVLDRYSFSGVCYSAAKDGLTMNWCKNHEIGLPAPDVVFFLDIPIRNVIARSAFGEERYEKVEFQEKVLNNFREMLTPKWKVLDASGTIDDLADEIEKNALSVIEASGSRPIGTLWEDS